jgi:hypothetical protein
MYLPRIIVPFRFGEHSGIPDLIVHNVRTSNACLKLRLTNHRNASRRNGKPASCEPCRINKTRCDHGTPKCDRCKQRGIEDRCFYHPAPLTKPRNTADDSAGTGEARPLKRKYENQRASFEKELTDQAAIQANAIRTYISSYVRFTT